MAEPVRERVPAWSRRGGRLVSVLGCRPWQRARPSAIRAEADDVAASTAALEDASREIMALAERLHATVAGYRREPSA